MLIQSKQYHLLDFIAIPLKNSPIQTILIFLNKVFSALLPSIQVLVTASFVDTAVEIFNGNADKNQIFLPLILIMGIISYQYLSWTLVSIVNLSLTMHLTESFRLSIVEKRSRLEYKHIEHNETWDLINRTCSDPVGRIMDGFNNIMSVLELILYITSILMIIMTQVWWAALLMIVISIPLFLIALKAGKTNYEAGKEADKHNRRANYLGTILTSRDMVEERSLFGYTKDINKKWYEKFELARKISLSVELKNFIRMKSTGILTIVISITIIAVLIPALGSGKVTIGLFMGLVSATLKLVQMISWQLSWITSQLANGKEYLKDLTTFSQLTEQDLAIELPQPIPDLKVDSIEFQHVTFQYPGNDHCILKDCSFQLKGNLHYAFVGINGAGKTTITKLLTGMYDNYEGDILINGKNLRTFTLPQLKSIFSVVYQDFARYYIPLKDNIKIGDIQQNNEQDMQNAIHTIQLDDVVQNLPNGVDTWLGKIMENGIDLSGGEWQRLAIARNIYNKSLVSILDEPTAALDPIAESNLYEMFGKISVGKSTIFITHRLGAAKLADEILVIDNGRVAEQGNHNVLITKNGIYANMFESQKGWYEE